ncbi:MAG TPA: type II secretion system protein, partial [Hyphomonas atlantica]|nr:type II secretion system protein [Hyphomonas atlantica]
ALPAQLTVPMILFFLPVLFLVVLGPAYIGFKASQEKNQASAPPAIETTHSDWG